MLRLLLERFGFYSWGAHCTKNKVKHNFLYNPLGKGRFITAGHNKMVYLRVFVCLFKKKVAGLLLFYYAHRHGLYEELIIKGRSEPTDPNDLDRPEVSNTIYCCLKSEYQRLGHSATT